MEADANEAQVECTNDVVGFGYYTSCLQVWDTDGRAAEEKASYARKLIQASGFTCVTEKLNSFRAWQGMMPGHVYANIRRPLVSTGNMAHVVPITAVWTGTKEQHIPRGSLWGGCSSFDLQHQLFDTVLPEPARRGRWAHLRRRTHRGRQVDPFGSLDDSMVEIPACAGDSFRQGPLLAPADLRRRRLLLRACDRECRVSAPTEVGARGGPHLGLGVHRSYCYRFRTSPWTQRKAPQS